MNLQQLVNNMIATMSIKQLVNQFVFFKALETIKAMKI